MAKEATSDAHKASLRRAYGAATQQLRENHRDEFNRLYAEHAKELGVEWNPRLSPEEKAAQAFDNLLAEWPDLADRIPSKA